eukprot:TRINITY_DN3339_c0_g1_i1.p2 TRINITY_DN3339_c0_g1~~TRINITY_DN3339_c0_g1_i1.p2  ORF type:complete len:176 (+),score=43.59 TRINITY_DN3339_c0_g1_i1:75-602(+)
MTLALSSKEAQLPYAPCSTLRKRPVWCAAMADAASFLADSTVLSKRLCIEAVRWPAACGAEKSPLQRRTVLCHSAASTETSAIGEDAQVSEAPESSGKSAAAVAYNGCLLEDGGEESRTKRPRLAVSRPQHGDAMACTFSNSSSSSLRGGDFMEEDDEEEEEEEDLWRLFGCSPS